MRSGFCAVVGRPNVGKSTLANALCGGEVAVATAVPQTTRHTIRGIRTTDEAQLVLLDTPGLHKPRTPLGGRMNDAARRALTGVDVVAVVVDAAAGIGRGDEHVVGEVAASGIPMVAVLNKIDELRPRTKQLPAIESVAGLADFAEVVPVSAATDEGTEDLASILEHMVPDGPAYFPAGERSDEPLRHRIADHIRAAAITRLRDEVPHSLAVDVTDVSDDGDPVEVAAELVVERDSQKGILVGKGGGMIGAIGTEARDRLRTLLARPVRLDLRARVEADWQRRERSLDRLGY